MASAYGTIASKGVRTPPTGIAQVTDDSGDVVWEPTSTQREVLEESVAVQSALMLHDVVESGTGMEARLADSWAAGKTGTTQSYRDAWFCGYAEDLSCATWVGYREAQVEMTNVRGIQVTGGGYPARIWRTFMEKALAHQGAAVTPEAPSAAVPNITQAPPAKRQGNVVISLCPDSMMLANKRCPAPIEMYLDGGLVPESTCDRH
jgi:penicillin-binding protein 1A